MEPAKIDWATIKSVFVVDDLYEHINAPKWIDFSSPDQSIDDEAWFCKPDCNHPKKVEDFLKGTTPSKKSASVSEILPLGDRNRRDANLKRRGLLQPPVSSTKDSKCAGFVEDGENQNPNFSTPTTSHQYNTMKAAIKSGTEKKNKKQTENSSQKEERPQLRSTMSARNLFAGRDILGQISEFCNELKRLATRAKERENVEKPSGKKKEEEKECGGEKLGEERKPLLEVKIEKSEATEKSNGKEKQMRKKRAEETENIPISLDLKTIKRRGDNSLSQIRTNPPSPQCFSAGRGPKVAPLKASSRLGPTPEGGIRQELGQSNIDLRKEEYTDSNNRGKVASTAAEKEARTLDVFWFLKPCTLTS